MTHYLRVADEPRSISALSWLAFGVDVYSGDLDFGFRVKRCAKCCLKSECDNKRSRCRSAWSWPTTATSYHDISRSCKFHNYV